MRAALATRRHYLSLCDNWITNSGGYRQKNASKYSIETLRASNSKGVYEVYEVIIIMA